MHTPIQHAHDGTVITYDEATNKWLFTLRGRDRSADSLAKAKEFIDRPVPKEKAKPFEKIPAWFFRYSAEIPVKVEVTGIAEDRSYGQQVWINRAGTRSKETAPLVIYPQTEANDVLVVAITAKQKEISKLRQECESLKKKLAPLVLPKDE